MGGFRNRRTGELVTVLRDTSARVWWRSADGATFCEAPRETFELYFEVAP